MKKSKIEQLALAGMFLALGILFPFVAAHGLSIPGTVLLPMHLPVLLAGFFCGPMYGLLCGLLLPGLNSLLTGMPVLFPMLPIMTGELATYGLVSGLLYKHAPFSKKIYGVYPCLLLSMTAGRAVYGLIFFLLFKLNGDLKALSVISAVVTGLPGICIQLLLIPSVVLLFRPKSTGKGSNEVKKAIKMIKDDVASCVVIRNNSIERTIHKSGIAPVMELYENGSLKGAYVVDKIIGKAAAMILTAGEVKGCYGVTMSTAATDWLKEHSIPFQYEICTEKIINRAGTDICPMEKTVQSIDNAEEAIHALKAKMY